VDRDGFASIMAQRLRATLAGKPELLHRLTG
jgi:hypothetical protein